MEPYTGEFLQDETAVSKQLGCGPKTLQAWRSRGGGPKFVKIGRLVRYNPRDVISFVESRRVGSTSERVK